MATEQSQPLVRRTLARSMGVSRGKDTVASLDKVDSIFSSGEMAMENGGLMGFNGI